MKKDVVVRLHASFEELVQHDPEAGGEYWLARDLQNLLGYAKWENFVKVIEKAKTACQASGYEAADHFLDVRKMVELGSGANREIEDIALTRYACYLVIQNADPAKKIVAQGQTSFAIQTRRHELSDEDVEEQRRLAIRRRRFAIGARAGHFRVGRPVAAGGDGAKGSFEGGAMLRESCRRASERFCSTRVSPGDRSNARR